MDGQCRNRIIMEELTQEEIINNCITLGTCEVLDHEIIPNSLRTRVTKAKYTWESYAVIQEIEYVEPVTSNSVYAIKSERRELV